MKELFLGEDNERDVLISEVPLERGSCRHCT